MDPATEMKLLRKKLFDLIIPSTTGLQLSRVYRFMHAQGLPITPWIAVSATDRARFTAACYDTGLISPNVLDVELDGISLYILQFSILFRDTDGEKYIGKHYGEIVLVHELVHGSGSHPEYLTRRRNGQIVQSQLGLIKDGKGHFLEESLARYIDLLYTHDVLGIYVKGETGPLPFDGLKLLIRQEPRLPSALKQAHLDGNNTEVARLIDATGGTGLYEFLYNLDPDEQSIVRGITAIRESVRPNGRRLYAI